MRYPARALGLLLALGFIWGVVYLFGLEFAQGDVYPEYSTLRSDPAGAKLLYDSLARLPELRVSHNYAPLEVVDVTHATLVLLGSPPQDLAAGAEILKKIAERGNRVVAAMPGQLSGASPNVLEKSLQVRLISDTDPQHVHKLSFAESAEWKVLERIGSKILAIERGYGSGSVVLLAESSGFTNQSTIAADRLNEITAALGDYPQIIFDESHFGIAESGSIVSLARQFRLTGFATGLAICFALWIWRAASAFPPPHAAHHERGFTGRTSHSGLLALLRRNIASRDLPTVCWEQWLSGNRNSVPPERIARASSIAREERRPLDAIHKIQTVLRKGQP